MPFVSVREANLGKRFDLRAFHDSVAARAAAH